MAKRGPYQKYTPEFREMALERMAECNNILDLAKELGVHSRLLYRCRDQQEAQAAAGRVPPRLREIRLRNENAKLKKAVAEKPLVGIFFRCALQQVEAP